MATVRAGHLTLLCGSRNIPGALVRLSGWVQKYSGFPNIDFIGGEVRNMSDLCGFTAVGQPTGHKLSIRQSSEDPSRRK